MVSAAVPVLVTWTLSVLVVPVGWLVKVKLSDPSETESLIDASTYEASLH